MTSLFRLGLMFLHEMKPPPGHEELDPAFAAVRDEFEQLVAGLQQQATNVINAALLPVVGTGVLVGRRVFATAGTFTYVPTTGTKVVDVEVLGGGAGGSGVLSASANQVNLGGGGGSGAWLRKRLAANFTGAIVVVGAKGTGGSSGNNSGTNGSASTFTDTAGNIYTAGGGTGGAPKTTFAPPISNVGAAGGTATGGDVNQSGNYGFPGVAPNQFVGYASGGGGSRYGQFTPAAQNVNAASAVGPSATDAGGGGSGAISSNAGGSKAGGDGAAGLIVIHEYS